MDRVLEAIKGIALKYHSIQKVVLFGSRARGDCNERSDYDIAVFGADETERLHFWSDIEDIDTLYKIDVLFVTEKLKEKPIYQNIQNEGVTIMDKFQTKLENYSKALARLHESLEETAQSTSLTLRDGVIQRFEFTAELAWKTVREYMLSEAIGEINSPKAVMRGAFANRLIADEDGWISILNDRNSTSHVYEEEEADAVFERIKTKHIVLLDELQKKLQAIHEE